MLKIVTVVVVLLPLVKLSASNDKYCKCNLLHVFCDEGMSYPSEELGKVKNPAMHKVYKKKIAENLNLLRQAVANGKSIFPQASNMQKLAYSNRLECAADMQLMNCNPWAGFKKTEEWCNHKCHKCTDIDGMEVHFSKLEINQIGKSKNFSLLINELKKPPDMYIFDISDNYTIPTPKEMPSGFKEIHYMALQAEYAEVGCSYITKNDIYYWEHTMLCAFGPVTPGMLERPLYKVGTKCCSCPINTRCSDKELKSLCVYEKGKSYTRTEGIAENGAYCKEPRTTGESTVQEMHVYGSDGTPKKIKIHINPPRNKDTPKTPGKEEDCKKIKLILS